MYRVELKAVSSIVAMDKFEGFLMYRVELKDWRGHVLDKEVEYRVPNVPCGVESPHQALQ